MYDWRDVHRTREQKTQCYELTAIPEEPIKLNTLPDALVKLASMSKFEDLSFTKTKKVPLPKSLGICNP